MTNPIRRNPSQPIGIFDSGVGGLTIAKAVTALLPHENIIYFGDTARAPWGDKSTATIQEYALGICDLMLKHHCKVILIACNTASAAAYQAVKNYVGTRARVLDVITPVVKYVGEHYSKKKIGLIGTKQTVYSNAYKKMIDDLNLGIELKALATPLLVPLIEEGYADRKIITEVLHEYLSHPDLNNIDALLLGCTHYPLIREHVSDFYHTKVTVVDASDIVARELRRVLQAEDLLHPNTHSQKLFYVSDYTAQATLLTRLFFGENVKLEKYAIQAELV